MADAIADSVDEAPTVELADGKPTKKLRKDDDLLGAERRLAFMLVAPTFVLMIAIMIYPLGQVDLLQHDRPDLRQ